MAKTEMAAATIVLGGPARFSYLHVFEPSSMEPDGKKKYSVSLIISKTEKELIRKIKDAIAAAKVAGMAKWGGKIPPNLKEPLRDGDAERPDDEAYKGSYFMNASSTQKPGIVDTNRLPLTTDEEFYPGCYGRFHVNFYAFNTAGNKGIAVGLNHLQKTRDGDRLAGRISVDAAFDDDYTEGEESDDMMG